MTQLDLKSLCALLALTAGAGGVWAQTSDCASFASVATPGMTLKTEVVPGEAVRPPGVTTGPLLVAHCKVTGRMAERMGQDGKPYLSRNFVFEEAIAGTAAMWVWEKQIAERFAGGFPWPMLIWPLLNTTLWLALWPGRVRLWGLVPAGIGAVLLLTLQPPDLLVSGDGRHVGLTGVLPGEVLVLRAGREGYARDTLLELAGMSGTPRALDQWSGAHCNVDLCLVQIRRGGRVWSLLLTRTRDRLPSLGR